MSWGATRARTTVRESRPTGARLRAQARAHAPRRDGPAGGRRGLLRHGPAREARDGARAGAAPDADARDGTPALSLAAEGTAGRPRQARARRNGDVGRARGGPGRRPGLLDGVRQWLAESGSEPTPARVAQALREQGRVLGDAEVLGAAERLRSELVGSGPLEPLLADPSVTDVLRVGARPGVGGPRRRPAADRRLLPGRGRRTTSRAAPRGGGRPTARRRPPLGGRPAAGRDPSARGAATGRAVGCTCLSLRVVRPRAFTLDELVAAGTVPPGGDRVLQSAAATPGCPSSSAAAPGSGKTTC